MGEITFHDLAPGDAGWLIERHAVLYARDEGFDARFEAVVARVLADFIEFRTQPVERAWIARDGAAGGDRAGDGSGDGSGGRRLGSLFCVKGPAPDAARLRLFLLEPEARGQGLGARLLRLCIDHARAHGFARLVLSTHESHRAACALYARTGFVCTAARPVRAFGLDLVEQDWALRLRD